MARVLDTVVSMTFNVHLGNATLAVELGGAVLVLLVLGGLVTGHWFHRGGFRTGVGDAAGILILAGAMTSAGFVVAHAVTAMDSSSAPPKTDIPTQATTVTGTGSSGSKSPATSGTPQPAPPSDPSTKASSSTESTTTSTGPASDADAASSGDTADLLRLLMVFVIGFALIGILLLYRRVPPVSPQSNGYSADLGRTKAELAASRAEAAVTSATHARNASPWVPATARGHAEDARREALAAETLAIEATAVASLLGRAPATVHAREAAHSARDAADAAQELVGLADQSAAPPPAVPPASPPASFQAKADIVIARAQATSAAATEAGARLAD
jgi:hypothetical protein